MKRSGYKTVFHIYIIFFALMVIAILVAVAFGVYNVTVKKPDGKKVLSNWPKDFTRDFSRYINFSDDKPLIKQSGLKRLRENNLWIQIIDKNGDEVQSFDKPQDVKIRYSPSELVMLNEKVSDKCTVFLENIIASNKEWTYIIGFPMKISKITMYVGKDKFTSGKLIIICIIGVMLILVIVSGIIYSFLITKQISQIRKGIRQIVAREYVPIINNGSMRDVYDELNIMNHEIISSDEARVRNDKQREDWIANITHDLKTPLSPIRGYSELISDPKVNIETNEVRKYGQIILKNTDYAEQLINDLKLTYQLESEMLPINKKKQNISRFVKELIIDILNNPEYELRNIEFFSANESIELSFDEILLKRAFNNLIINALVHNNKETEISVSISKKEKVEICVQDNGRGMSKEEVDNLFSRYYRGTNMEEKPEGSGLGMAISKQIIELHGGVISVESKIGSGTSFFIKL